MKFFTSDLHLNSDQILKTDNRPFKSPKHFCKFLISLWNKQTKFGDIVYVIGDFFDCHEETCDNWQKCFCFLKKLKAKAVLITGNNEQRIIKNYFNNNFEDFKIYCIKNGFLDVKQNFKVLIENKEFYLTHKPKDCDKTTSNLFGHSHRAMGLYKSFGFNIGCDLNHFRLYSEEDIKRLLYMKNTYWDKDENLKLV